MTQEDKELLLKDLCARLPYNVIVDYGYNAFNVRKGSYVERGTKCILGCYLLDVFISPRQNEKGEYIKPYLFPLSSMTEEQKKDFMHCACYEIRDEDCGRHTETYYYDLVGHESTFYPNADAIDWLNKNHFDYRGLIEKGLATDATGLNIY